MPLTDDPRVYPSRAAMRCDATWRDVAVIVIAAVVVFCCLLFFDTTPL